ncbi:conjugal transfer protein TraR [Acinetobacter bereziniae]|uniref:conjugal transfer protein TraR n=1 Tax=Acinetobacter bereziniae TaxID=106648 RepID=UPI0025786A54|nr:conjugal transfer protein TraR [Acinetobacter bereziniae]MDM1784251.1 conjugal transfer protein TraR [Acinetobacter bereziniae]
MSDPIDRAQENQLNQVQRVPKNYDLPSSAECEHCGNDIPPERQAYGNIHLCVECQNIFELNGKRYGR